MKTNLMNIGIHWKKSKNTDKVIFNGFKIKTGLASKLFKIRLDLLTYLSFDNSNIKISDQSICAALKDFLSFAPVLAIITKIAVSKSVFQPGDTSLLPSHGKNRPPVTINFAKDCDHNEKKLNSLYIISCYSSIQLLKSVMM